MVLSAFSLIWVSLDIRYRHLVFYPVMLLVLLRFCRPASWGHSRPGGLLTCWLTLQTVVTLNTAGQGGRWRLPLWTLCLSLVRFCFRSLSF